MITIFGLRVPVGGRTLFRDASLRLAPRDRVALVGPNGSGKTTLLEMILVAAGATAASGRGAASVPEAGTIDVAKDVTVGYLPQEAERLRGRTVLEEVVSAGDAMREAGHRLQRLEGALSRVQGEEREGLLAEYAAAQARFTELGGYGLEAEARRILSGLGFSERDAERPTGELSGGWLMRVALAKLLLAAPDVLLLDEPTNHLDLESIRWLEGFLRDYEGAFLLVSHDRDFMNATCNRIVELHDGDLVSYTGSFEDFVRQRAERVEQLARLAKDQQKRVAEIERFIERFRYKASKAKQVQSRIKALDRLERVEAPKERRRSMGVRFPAPPRSGRVVCALESVNFSYADNAVYRALDVEIERGDKVALVGPNGAGKTTLLKLLAGALEPQLGERRLGHNVSCGYFAQHTLEALDAGARVIEEVQRSLPPDAPVRPRDLLGRFLFSGDDVDKPVSVLSGGERTRLALAKLLCEPHNFLCLDEPTNHLDMPSRDVLEDALGDYGGSLVLITHDRHLIRSVANRIIAVSPGGRVYSHPGDYESYLWHVEQSGQAHPAETAEAPRHPRRGDDAKVRRRKGAERRARLKRYRDAVAAVEDELEAAHREASRLESRLAAPDFYGSADAAEAVRRHGELRARIDELEPEWERAATALEEAERELESEVGA